MGRDKISACLTVGNEEDKVRRCLSSLLWADEIVVVDSFSKDNTVAICREYTDKVYQHEWLGYVGQKDLIKKMARYKWILFIDADEEVSVKLKNQILSDFNQGINKRYVGYEFPRKVYFLGQWIVRGEWWPDIKMRLYHRDYGICAGKEPHDQVVVNGPVKRLSGCLYHYTYDDITDQVDTANRFSTIAASTMQREQYKFSCLDLLFRPLWRFFKGYFLKRGVLDGMTGFIIAVLNAFSVFLKYAKLWEISKMSSNPETEEKSESTGKS
jgi:glycosyltransferase involved in cell wall biosynthesis